MKVPTSCLIALLLCASPVLSKVPIKIGQRCVKGVHMIVARGSEEPPGEGASQVMTFRVKELVDRSYVEAVDYPASGQNYTTSQPQGVRAAKQAIEGYVKFCGEKVSKAAAHIVLVGYSQGAHIMTDVLSGGTFAESAPLEERYAKHVQSVILFGDPSFALGQTYDVGTANMGGIFRRTKAKLARYEKYANRTQSYCDNGDPYCEQGNRIKVHYRYVEHYTNPAAKFVADRFYES